MKKSQYRRGEFIKAKIGLSILHDLGSGKIDAEQAGDLDNLMREIEMSGVTFNLELAKHPYYQKAIEVWRGYLEAKRQSIIESGRA